MSCTRNRRLVCNISRSLRQKSAFSPRGQSSRDPIASLPSFPQLAILFSKVLLRGVFVFVFFARHGTSIGKVFTDKNEMRRKVITHDLGFRRFEDWSDRSAGALFDSWHVMNGIGYRPDWILQIYAWGSSARSKSFHCSR